MNLQCSIRSTAISANGIEIDLVANLKNEKL